MLQGCWHQRCRDHHIGWSDRARVARRGLIVNNRRFLILPSVRVRDLASHVVGLATARIARDWEAAHGVRPVLAYTYVGPGHSGMSYRASGWRCVGLISGTPPGRRVGGAVRKVWVQHLCADWREQLCRKPKPDIGLPGRLHPAGDWAVPGFGCGSSVPGHHGA